MNNEAKVVWDYLQANLNEQASAYTRLLNLLQQENQTLISRTPSQLNELTSQKELLTPQIMNLNKDMLSIISRILVAEPGVTINLGQVIEVAPEEYRTRLLKSKNVLNKQKQELIQLKYRNQKLMENSLKYVQHMMNRMMDLCSDHQEVYCSRGNTSIIGGNRNLMDIVA